MSYFSEKEIADAPCKGSFLDVPLAIDGVVAFADKILIDVSDWV